MVSYYGKLLIRFGVISWHKVRAFNFEFIMMLVHLIFNLSFILLFWYTLLGHIPAFGEWGFQELALYSSVTLLGEALGGIFFGFRDLPARITSGQLDKFLVRPVNTLFAVLFEQVSVVYFLEQLIVSGILIGTIIISYQLPIDLANALVSFVVLVVGVVAYNCLYGGISFLAFWVGRVEIVRSLFFSIGDSKQYPLTIFPFPVQLVLTYIIPVAFISYYPTALLLGKYHIGVGFVFKLLLLAVCAVLLLQRLWQAGLKRYEANGG